MKEFSEEKNERNFEGLKKRNFENLMTEEMHENTIERNKERGQKNKTMEK